MSGHGWKGGPVVRETPFQQKPHSLKLRQVIPLLRGYTVDNGEVDEQPPADLHEAE